MMKSEKSFIVSFAVVGLLLMANPNYNLGMELPDNGINEASSPSSSDGVNLAANTSGKPCGSYSNAATMVGLNNVQVAGSIITVNWRVIEPSEGNFDWSEVDLALKRAKRAHKPVTLNLIAGGASTPDWVKGTPGVELISIFDTNSFHSGYCRRVSIPLFWDEIFLAKKLRLIARAGSKYGHNPNVLGVMVSFANAFTNDWSVATAVGSYCGKEINHVKAWLNKGYTTEKMLNAGKMTIDAWAAAFPGKALKLPIRVTHKNLDGTASNLADKIISYGYATYPDTFYAQSNSLNASTPYASSSKVTKADPNSDGYILKLLTQHPNHIGLQMLASASNGKRDNCRQNAGVSPCPPYDVLMESVERGLSYSPAYIEYWREDAENMDFQDILKYANDGMGSCSEVTAHGRLRIGHFFNLAQNQWDF